MSEEFGGSIDVQELMAEGSNMVFERQGKQSHCDQQSTASGTQSTASGTVKGDGEGDLK